VAPPPALLDECTDLELVPLLRARGYVVEAVHLLGLRGADDAVVLDYAARRGRALVTHNERHFRHEHRRLVEAGRTHAGIICISQLGPIERMALRVAMMLDWVAQQENRAQLFVSGRLQEQLERGLRLAGHTEEEVLFVLART
jgi:hypothetical protein